MAGPPTVWRLQDLGGMLLEKALNVEWSLTDGNVPFTKEQEEEFWDETDWAEDSLTGRDCDSYSKISSLRNYELEVLPYILLKFYNGHSTIPLPPRNHHPQLPSPFFGQVAKERPHMSMILAVYKNFCVYSE
nr:hypothetical protein L203_04986 [Cryptococcus depauperatus CBS 7841]